MARIEEKLFINGEDKTGPAVRSAVAGQKKLGKSTKATGQTMAQSAVRFRTAVLQVAAAVGVYRAIGFSADLLSVADNIGKVADKVGLTTDELQELRFAAELVNVQTTALDMGMQRFSRRLGEAAQGMGELLGIAEQYDVQLRDSNGRMRSNIDVLNDFADVMRNAESDQERLRIAFKLFDSEGAALVNIFTEGSAGLDIMRRKAQELGIVVEEDLIRKAGLAQDELKILSTVIKSQLTIAVAGLAPEIEAASSAMTDFVINWVEGVKVIKDFFTVTQGEEIIRLEGLLDGFTEAVVKNKRILAGEGGFFESLGVTKIHERNLREAEASVIRITERIKALRGEEQKPAPPGGGVGGGGLVPDQAALQKARDEEIAFTLQTQAFIQDIRNNEIDFERQRLDFIADMRQTSRDEEIEFEIQRQEFIADLKTQELEQAQNVERIKQQLAQQTAGNAAALLNFLSRENKTAALAALVLTKGLAIAQTIAWGKVAEAGAMASLPGLPGIALAAKIAVITKINVGLIAALGLLQGAAIAGGGGGGGGGAGGAAAAPGPGAVSQQAQALPPQAQITINILGNVLDQDQFVRDIAPAIKEAVGAGSDFGLEVATI